VPAGVLNVVTGRGDVVAQRSRSTRHDFLALTGDSDTGKVVAALASTNLKRVHLELGGKAPFVVFATRTSTRRAAAPSWAVSRTRPRLHRGDESVRGTAAYHAFRPCCSTTSPRGGGDPLSPTTDWAPDQRSPTGTVHGSRARPAAGATIAAGAGGPRWRGSRDPSRADRRNGRRPGRRIVQHESSAVVT